MGDHTYMSPIPRDVVSQPPSTTPVHSSLSVRGGVSKRRRASVPDLITQVPGTDLGALPQHSTGSPEAGDHPEFPPEFIDQLLAEQEELKEQVKAIVQDINIPKPAPLPKAEGSTPKKPGGILKPQSIRQALYYNLGKVDAFLNDGVKVMKLDQWMQMMESWEYTVNSAKDSTNTQCRGRLDRAQVTKALERLQAYIPGMDLVQLQYARTEGAKLRKKSEKQQKHNRPARAAAKAAKAKKRSATTSM